MRGAITTRPGPIESYLAGLRRRLPRGRSGHDVLTELRDGLEDAAEAYRSAGLAPVEAERRAVADFGDAEEIGDLCRTEVEAAAGFRAAVVVAVGYPLILGLWGGYYDLFGSVSRWDNGEPVGSAFTAVGAVGFVLALLTCLWLRFGARTATRRRRPVMLAFAVATLCSIVATGLLAVVTHEVPAADLFHLIIRQIVQFLSAAVMAVMAYWIAASVRIAGLRHTVSIDEPVMRTTRTSA
jgi:hypothetical protein